MSGSWHGVAYLPTQRATQDPCSPAPVHAARPQNSDPMSCQVKTCSARKHDACGHVSNSSLKATPRKGNKTDSSPLLPVLGSPPLVRGVWACRRYVPAANARHMRNWRRLRTFEAQPTHTPGDYTVQKKNKTDIGHIPQEQRSSNPIAKTAKSNEIARIRQSSKTSIVNECRGQQLALHT